jgi:hypothetical protein
VSRHFWVPPTLAVLGGLVLMAATAAPWVIEVSTRDMGGVPVEESTSLPGVGFAAAAVGLGLAALGGGGVLAVLRGVARRVAGLGVMGLGIAAVVVLVRGIVLATQEGGSLTAAPWTAAVGAAAVAGAGVLAALRAAAPPAASPYRVGDERSTDDEWTLAADE